MSLIGTNNEEKIWNYLKAQGLSDCGVAGLMGNLYAESGLNPKNVQNSYEKKLGYTDETYTAAVDNGSYTNFVKDAAGYGIAQWTYWSRKQGLLEYAKAAGKSVGDLEVQLGYLLKELSSYGLLAALKSATSVKEASNLILLKFEKPASMNSESTQTKRASYGQNYFDKYAGKESQSMSFTPRLTRPETGNKYYIRKASGGYSSAVQGSPKDSQCDVLSNCVGYANGRFNEIIGAGKESYALVCNAEQFATRAKALGLTIGQTPQLGAIAIWQAGATLQGTDGAGHVAVVEKIVSATEIVTSESGWNASKPFWTQTRKKGAGNWGQGSSYKFLGFIYNPAACCQETAPTTGSTTTTTTTGTVKPTATATEKKATGVAKSFDKTLAGTYAVTASSGLHVRNVAGASDGSMVVLPCGTKVQNYGYYTLVGKVKWLYIQVTYNGVKYTGFSSSEYLKKS